MAAGVVTFMHMTILPPRIIFELSEPGQNWFYTTSSYGNSSMLVKNGDFMKIQCHADSHSNWIRLEPKNTPIRAKLLQEEYSGNRTETMLLFESIGVDDSGTYACVQQSGTSVESTAVTIKVQKEIKGEERMEKINIIRHTPNNVIAEPGDMAQFCCEWSISQLNLANGTVSPPAEKFWHLPLDFPYMELTKNGTGIEYQTMVHPMDNGQLHMVKCLGITYTTNVHTGQYKCVFPTGSVFPNGVSFHLALTSNHTEDTAMFNLRHIPEDPLDSDYLMRVETSATANLTVRPIVSHSCKDYVRHVAIGVTVAAIASLLIVAGLVLVACQHLNKLNYFKGPSMALRRRNRKVKRTSTTRRLLVENAATVALEEEVAI